MGAQTERRNVCNCKSKTHSEKQFRNTVSISANFASTTSAPCRPRKPFELPDGEYSRLISLRLLFAGYILKNFGIHRLIFRELKDTHRGVRESFLIVHVRFVVLEWFSFCREQS